jgi:hypothetical protein
MVMPKKTSLMLQWSRVTLGFLVLGGFLGAADIGQAQGVTVPNTFVNGEVADADEVNANFTAITDALDVTVPNSFANSGIADANEVNTNFDALKTAVDTFTNDLAAATSATETATQNGCIAGGGTWNAGTSTCTAGYNCFVGGFCAQAAINFPPSTYDYTNVYDGHTQGTEPALGAGCNTSPSSNLWVEAQYLIPSFQFFHFPDNEIIEGMCQ